MNTRLADRCVDGLGDDLAGAGMRRMALYHYGAARRERRGRIAAAVEKASGKFEAPKTATGPTGRWTSRIS